VQRCVGCEITPCTHGRNMRGLQLGATCWDLASQVDGTMVKLPAELSHVDWSTCPYSFHFSFRSLPRYPNWNKLDQIHFNLRSAAPWVFSLFSDTSRRRLTYALHKSTARPSSSPNSNLSFMIQHLLHPASRISSQISSSATHSLQSRLLFSVPQWIARILYSF
jgi:hypothetical protein